MQFVLPTVEAAARLHTAQWKDCKECPLGTTDCNRSQVVLWRGYLPCDILFVGEGPGRDEDAQGFPFVGPSGGLLDELIRRAEDSLNSDKIFTKNIYCFTNVVCCLPLDSKGGIREPTLDEMVRCSGRFQELFKIANPSVVVFVGSVAEKLITAKKPSILPVGFFDQTKVSTIPHPASLLRQPKHVYVQLYQKTITILRQAFVATIPF